MFISDYAIKRPLITVVVMIALAAAGTFALLRLKTDEFPDIQQPVVFTAIVYPGASPEQVETELLSPVEEAIQSISGVDQMLGEARDGYAQIITMFNFEKDPQQATQDIRDAISAIRIDLPAEMEEPLLRRFDPIDFPIMQVSLTSSVYSPAELTRIVEPRITRELRSIAGVAQAAVVGNIEREMTVQLNPSALQAAGLSVAEVAQSLQFQNLAAPVGRINTRLEERTIRLKGRLEGAEEFKAMVVSQRNGRIIRLGQVAEVFDGTQEQRSLALYDSLDAVGIDITKAKGFSTTDVTQHLRERIEAISADLPEGVSLRIVRDAGVTVSASVKRVQETLLEGALLTVLVVFIFLNSWRSTIITGLALPISVLASFVAVWAFGFRLETMSLLGLSLAIGILIDDAIVVRENIVRHIRMGKDHYTAAHDGTNEIGLAVSATTFAIVSVFVPVAFMYGVSGQWFKPFALTIACSVLVSLFVSFSLDPMLSAYWPDPHVAEERKAWITRKLDRFNDWFNRLADRYRRVIAWALDHRAAVVFIAVVTFVGAMMAPAMQLVGVGFFPVDDRSEFTVAVETPPGSSFQYTRAKTNEIIQLVSRHDSIVEYTYTTLGGGGGTVDVASIYVRMVPMHEREISADEFSQVVRNEVSSLAGVTASVFANQFAGGFKQIQLQLRGDNTAALAEAGEMLIEQVRQVPNAVDVSLSTKGLKPELEVQLNRGLAGSLGITVGQVAQSLRPAFAGIDVGDWVDPSGETRDVMVRLAPGARSSPADLAQLPIMVTGAEGRPTSLPLGQIATISQSTGPARITHLDGDKVVTVEGNVQGRSYNEVMADIDARIATLTFPAGVRLTRGGEAADQAEVFGNIFAALGIAVVLMYLILVVQFGSFLDPLAILLSLPLSLIGVMIALAVTRNTINIMSLIGVILLMGIVAKNAILLIDFAKWARERGGLPLREALIEAGAIRLRPILMTTFALIAGMIPVSLGGGEGAQFRSPLGIAVIGGVITSTLLTLVAIPTFYEILDDTRSWFSRQLGFKPKQMTAEHRIDVHSATSHKD
jgi:HAE1 family hydrophobic/amphiphilic exporter-1